LNSCLKSLSAPVFRFLFVVSESAPELREWLYEQGLIDAFFENASDLDSEALVSGAQCVSRVLREAPSEALYGRIPAAIALFERAPLASAMIVRVLCERPAQKEDLAAVNAFAFGGLKRLISGEDVEAGRTAEEILWAIKGVWGQFRDARYLGEIVTVVGGVFSSFAVAGVQRAALGLWRDVYEVLPGKSAYRFGLRLPHALFLQMLEEGTIAEVELMALFTAMARVPDSIDTLMMGNIISAIFENHEKFAYATRQQCCVLFVEIIKNATDGQLSRIVSGKRWGNRFLELVMGLLEADDVPFQSVILEELRNVFTKIAYRSSDVFDILRNAFREVGGLRMCEFVEGRNAEILEAFIGEFGLDERSEACLPNDEEYPQPV
jgi:hypothetical protein